MTTIEPVAHHLLGEPNPAQSTKTQWRYGRKGSLAVDLKKNTFYDHEAGEGGGILDLVCRERGGSHKEAIEWLQGLGLWENGGVASLGKPKDNLPSFEDRTRLALSIWRECDPVYGTDGQEYLAGRGILCRLPDDLRFHPALRHPNGLTAPALVAAISDPGGRFAGIQRIYLERTPRGVERVDRRSLGPPSRAALFTSLWPPERCKSPSPSRTAWRCKC